MRYETPSAFRRALEDRLKLRANGDGARIARNRKRVVFDRFLARLVATASGEWVLKGGFALDLRLEDRARATKDIDLGWCADGDDILDVLIDVANHNLGDFFTFAIERSEDSPERFGGAHRFRGAAELAGRPFETFVVDVGRADKVVGSEVLTTLGLLDFAGISQVKVPTIPIAVHAAEKLHAYTRIYEGGRISSRVKDLVDLGLTAEFFVLDAEGVRQAIETTFASRGTHQPPRSVPPSPDSWRTPFRQLAQTVGLDPDLDAGHRAVAAMLDPVLDHRVRAGTWSPDAQRWINSVAN